MPFIIIEYHETVSGMDRFDYKSSAMLHLKSEWDTVNLCVRTLELN